MSPYYVPPRYRTWRCKVHEDNWKAWVIFPKMVKLVFPHKEGMRPIIEGDNMRLKEYRDHGKTIRYTGREFITEVVDVRPYHDNSQIVTMREI